jgi:decaprenyl-phosphate phosphoribosyltransferase
MGPTLKGYLEIARVDHWVKNVFVLPGIVVALSVDHSRVEAWSWVNSALGAIAICLIASSNYVLNEILDAPFDLLHPSKASRPIPAGRASVPWAYAEWIVLMAAGLAAGWRISKTFEGLLLALWVMGCFYNIPPIRTKDVPYLDVLSERSTIPCACFWAGI